MSCVKHKNGRPEISDCDSWPLGAKILDKTTTISKGSTHDTLHAVATVGFPGKGGGVHPWPQLWLGPFHSLDIFRVDLRGAARKNEVVG